MNKLHLALKHLRPNCEWYQVGDDLDGVVWVKPENTTTPTQSEIDAAIVQIEADEISATAKADIAKAAAQAKLAALGLTTDDLKALGLGGN